MPSTLYDILQESMPVGNTELIMFVIGQQSFRLLMQNCIRRVGGGGGDGDCKKFPCLYCTLNSSR